MEAVSYIDENRNFRTYKLSLIEEHGCSRELFVRLKYAISMVERLQKKLDEENEKDGGIAATWTRLKNWSRTSYWYVCVFWRVTFKHQSDILFKEFEQFNIIHISGSAKWRKHVTHENRCIKSCDKN